MKQSGKLFIALLFACTAHVASAETLRIAIEGAYPPFNYVDSDNELHGFDVDIAKAICAEMKVECQLVTQDWDGIIPGLLAKRYDTIIASMVVTPERAEAVGFTDRYYRTHLAIAVERDSDIKGVAPEDMAGKIVGGQSSTAMSSYAEKHFTPAGATVKLYPTQDDANNDLEVGRLDATINDIFPLMDWLEKKGKDCCKMIGNIEGTSGDAAFAVRKEDTELRDRLNKAIVGIRASGVYQKISNQYFKMDVYD